MDRLKLGLCRKGSGLRGGDLNVPLMQCGSLLSQDRVSDRNRGERDTQLSHERVEPSVQSGILGLDRGGCDG